MLKLENTHWRMTLDETSGGNIHRCQISKAGKWLELMPNCLSDEVELKEANFAMIPYSNRVRDGQFTHQGETISLNEPERHAIHGVTRRRPWQVKSQSDENIVLLFDSRDFPEIAWPWPFQATQSYTLSGQQFSHTIEIQNLSEYSMPCGSGWHPYFNRQLQAEDNTVELQFNIEKVYPDAQDNRIPSGPAILIDEVLDFSTSKVLDPKVHIDMCSSGYDGKGIFYWPNSAIKLHVNSSQDCDYLVFYNPDAPWFAFEPVSHATNAFNEKEPESSGIKYLSNNETFSIEITMSLEYL